MLERYRAAPWWVLALTQAVAYAAIWVLFFPLFLDVDAAAAAGPGVGFGLVMGPVMALLAAEGRKREGDIMGLRDESQRRAVRRAVHRGEAPTDPALREPALALSRLQLRNARQLRITGILVSAGLIIFAIVRTLQGQPLTLVLGGIGIGFAALALIRPLQLSRRAKRLQHPAPARPDAAHPDRC